MKSILVVDDEQGIVLALEIVLAQDYRVLKAASGEEALLSIKDCTPDLVLLDIMMPGLGGLETLKLIRSHPQFKSLPVVIMSGARPLVRQADYGWTAFINKPFTGDQILKLIARHI